MGVNSPVCRYFLIATCLFGYILFSMQLDIFNRTQNQILESKSYGDFKNALAVSDCDRCALSRFRQNIVVDRGNPEARVLMIGEGPGASEDIQAKAFVGRAGQLLDRLLLDLGFDTNCDSLIANVVKCRPPDNRAPKQEEVDACTPFLKRQIELVQPKAILLLGATAFKHIIKDKGSFSMKEEVGKFFEHDDFPNIQFMVLFHPAYILRDPRKKPLMIEHLKRFLEHWHKIK
jgi:uracil-DNA glycosylase